MLTNEINTIITKIDTLAAIKLSTDLMPLAFWVKEFVEGRFIMRYLNDEYERRYLIPNGFTKKDYIGKYDHEVWPQDVADKFHNNDITTYNKKARHEFEEKVTIANKTYSEHFLKTYVKDPKTNKEYIPGSAIIIDPNY